MGVSPFTVRVCPYLPLLFCASSMCVPCFCLSVPCVCWFLSLYVVFVSLFGCAGSVCFLYVCSGVLVSSLGVYVSWYLCVLCVGGLVFVSGLCVLFPVVCGVLLDVFCVYVLCSCFLCGWSCLGLRVCVWCIGCWVIWCACVSWVFCVCVWVAYCVVCALCVCSFIGCAVCFMCGVVSLLVCCAWCFGCWSLPVWLWWVSGFGRVLFFWVLAWFCFLVGCWGFVFCWAVVCWFDWWFVFVGCLGGFCVLGVGGCVLFFWSYIICVDCGGALRVSACVGFLFGVTACFLGVCS